MKKNEFSKIGVIGHFGAGRTLMSPTVSFMIKEHINLYFGVNTPNQKLDIPSFFDSKSKLKTPFKPKVNLLK